MSAASRNIIFLLQLVSFCYLVDSYKILAIAPYSGRSHWEIFRPLLEELARRGNKVTVITHHPRETPLENYNEINIGSNTDPGRHTKNMDTINVKSNWFEMHAVLSAGANIVCGQGLYHPKVQKLYNSNETFDVVISEIFTSDCFLGFVHKYQSPNIAIRTAPLSPWTNYRVANPDNPSYIPNSLLGKSTYMGFRDRLENLLGVLYYKAVYAYYNRQCTEHARRFFGNDLPELEDIARNTSMILVNTHYTLQYARPLVPGIREIAGIHIGQPKKLPKQFDDWISNSEHGVVYFSLGSMLKSSSMSNEKRQAFLDAFAEIPQRVIMKWEDNDLKNLPRNVKTFSWTPQYDILSHPKVKLFISHAGMLSSVEAVYSGTPLIVIPAYGDQPTNALLLEENGVAIKLRYSNLTKDTILSAMKRILYDPKYQENAKLRSQAIRDRLVPPVEEAAYWVEYVARYKGANFLRSPAINMPLYQYLLLDVIATLFVVALILIYVIYLFIRLVFWLLCGSRKRKLKRE